MADHDDDWILFRLQRLNPVRFEELCFALLKAKGHQDVRHLGASGSDLGVDVLSMGPDKKRWATQCKRHRSLSPSDVRSEIEKVITKPMEPPPEVYHLVATCNVSRDSEEALLAETKKAHSDLELASTWAATELVAFLRDDFPDLRENFIGLAGTMPFWNVPNRNEFFTGREELLDGLTARLEASNSAVLTQTSSGLGGVGKTQMAIEYCHRHRSAYEAGVYWVDASSPEALEVEYARLAVARGLAGEEVPVGDAAATLRREFDRWPGWLVVLDNADEVEGIRALLPPDTGGHALMTTRSWKRDLGQAESLPIDVLPEKEATIFLLQRARRGSSEHRAARDLAGALGCLPLALEQAGAYLDQQPIEISSYLERFQKLRLDLLKHQASMPGPYDSTVAATCEISLRRLEVDSPASAGALRACGLLAPNGIPMEFFVGAADHLGPALSVLGSQFSKDSVSLRDRIVEPLISYSLANFDRVGGGRLSLHRLVREVIRHRLHRDGLASEMNKRVQRALDTCFPRKSQSPTSWPSAKLWLPHVQSSAKAWLKQAEEPRWDPTELWFRAANYALAAGRASEAKSLNEATLKVRRRVLGKEDPATLASMNELAQTLRALGNASGARELHEATLRIRRRALGGEHPETLSSMNNLAMAFSDLGNLARARRLQEETLRIRVRTLGAQHSRTLASMNNLALTLRDQGKLKRARILQEKALEIHRRKWGDEHPATLSMMHNLAVTFRTLGDAAGARELHGVVLEISRRVLGEEHPSTLSSMNNFAETARALGDAAGARDDLESVVELQSRVLGKEHPDTLNSMHHLAETLRDLGDSSSARELQEAVLELNRRLWGPVHPSSLTSMDSLCRMQEESDEVELDRGMVEELLSGVRLMPKGTPLRVAVEKQWLASVKGNQRLNPIQRILRRLKKAEA